MNVNATPRVTTAPSRGAKLKRYALLGLGIAVSYAAIFAFGYVSGRGELSAVEGSRASLENELKKARSDSAKELEEERRKTTLLRARRSLDQALRALDERNFGTAQQMLKLFSEQATESRAEGRLIELGKTVGAYRLLATEDFGAQRQTLSGYVASFDALYPHPKP
jgi:hypothetical protein